MRSMDGKFWSADASGRNGCFLPSHNLSIFTSDVQLYSFGYVKKCLRLRGDKML